MDTNLTIVLILALLATLVWILFPGIVASILIRLNSYRLGFKSKTIEIDSCSWHWLESGAQDSPVIVMLHGYNGDANNWVSMSPWLKNYRLIIPDIPPFGKSSCTSRYAKKTDYSIKAQAWRLDKFLNHLGINKFYLAGNSMGGYIAGEYTYLFEDKVLGLILFSPAYVSAVPPLIKYQAALKRGENPLKVESMADLDELIDNCFYSKGPQIPGPVKKRLLKQILSIGKTEDWIFFNMAQDSRPLEKLLGPVSTPTLIFWGEADAILNPAGAVVLRNSMQNAKLIMPAKTGHVPMLEYPRLCAQELSGFIESLNKT